MKNISHPASNQHTPSRRPWMLAVVGPTAAGKTDLALEAAERIGAEIVCVDAIQVYRGLDVGSAKPTGEQRRRVAHHGLDLAEPDEWFSANRFAELVEPVLIDAQREGRPLVLCGGTGLYYRALLEGFFKAPEPDPALRESLRRRFEREGPEAAHAELARLDPPTAEGIHPHDARRALRALELIEQTGEPVSALRARQTKKSWIGETLFVGVERERSSLHHRIQQRTRWMFDNGLIEETRRAIERGCEEGCTAMQALGYKECRRYLVGEWTLERAIDETETGTRRYAKRQMTWFRRQAPTHWLRWDEGRPLEEIAKQCLHVWNNRS